MIDVELKMYEEDVWPLFVAAFRYALGRRTYMTLLIPEIILANRKRLDRFQREQLAREVYEFKEMFGTLGDQCDETSWVAFADEILKE